jgi:hypothetical protein
MITALKGREAIQKVTIMAMKMVALSVAIHFRFVPVVHSVW